MVPGMSFEEDRVLDLGLMPNADVLRMFDCLQAQAQSGWHDFEELLPRRVRDLAYQISDCIEQIVARGDRLTEERVLKLAEALDLDLERVSGGGFSAVLHSAGGSPSSKDPAQLRFLFVPQGETLPPHQHGFGDTSGLCGETLVTLQGELHFKSDGMPEKHGKGEGLRLRSANWVDVHLRQAGPWAGLVYEGGAPTDVPDGIESTQSLYVTY